MSFELRSSQWVACIFFGLSLALSCAAQTLSYATDTRAYNLAHGRVVFNDKCMRCHESGRKGAPVVGDVADWKERLGQPLDTLIEHAVSGHGRMPARGDQDVTDQDVAAAVAYVVDRTRQIAADQLQSLPPPAAGNQSGKGLKPADQAAVHMFLMMFGKDRWK
jgi:cytochrome c5